MQIPAMFYNKVIRMPSLDARGAAWRKSRRSMPDGNCVEAAEAPGGILVRDSADRTGVLLRYSVEVWRTFASRVRVGEFDVVTK